MKMSFRYFSFLIVMLCVFPVSTYGAYLATDILGQLDPDDQPIYTKNGANNGPSNRGFSQPIGIAIDTVSHRLFVAETANRRILVFNLDNSNNLIDYLPDNVIGQLGFTTNTSAVTQSGIASVQGIAYDATNNWLFVPDSTNHRVLVFDVSTITNGMNASYVLGQADFTSNSSAITQGGMNGPSRITYDPGDDRLFVADTSNNRVLVFDLSSGITNGMNAEYVLGQPDFTTGTAATTQSKMNIPGSPVLDADTQRLFVPEFSNNRVTVWDVDPDTIASGSNAINVLGQALFTTLAAATTQAGLSGPADASFDSATNRLFVSGFNNHRITVFDVAAITDGENAVSVLGQANFTTGTATTTQSATRTPAGQAYDSANNRLYVAERDNHRVMIFDVAAITDGENAIDVLGKLDENDQPVYTKSAANNGPNNRGLNRPLDAAFDTVNHRLFVTEDGNRRVLVFNLDANNELIDRVADYVIGQADFDTVATTASINTLGVVAGVVYDSDLNRLFVADRGFHRVLVFDLSGGITNGMNASYVIGQPDFTTITTGITQSKLNLPQGDLAYDLANKRLFVIDRANNRVLVYDLLGGITNGMNAAYVLGQADFISNAAATTQSGMSGPIGLAYDSSAERLFIIDATNNRITEWDVDPDTISNGMNASHVLGQSTFLTATAATSQAGLSAPQELGYDPVNNRLFAAEFTNRRITVWDVHPDTIADGANALAVLGQPDFTSSTSAVTADGAGAFVSALYDIDNNRLYGLDYNNFRISIYDFINLLPSFLSNAYASREYSQVVPTDSSQGSVSLTLTSGTLPPGLSLSGDRIIGEPTTVGTYNFSLTGIDDNGTQGIFTSQPQSYTLVVTEPPISSGSRPKSRANIISQLPPVSPSSNSSSPTPSTCTITTNILKLSSRGADVSCLQQKLNTLLTLNLDTDGIFGPLTNQAVVKFQHANGLDGDGIVGPLTRAVLK